MKNFLHQCGIIRVDHVALTTPNLNDTVDAFLGVPGASLLNKNGWNATQKVDYAFVQLAPGFNVEVLQGGRESPIYKHIKSGGGPYHFCFQVIDINHAVRTSSDMGAVKITEITPDPAFSDGLIVFMYHTALGVFEFVECKTI